MMTANLPKRFRSMRHVQGITLLELMIVVVVVGIMASIAYPQYRDYAAKAKRTEAVRELLKIQANQERHYLNNNAYTSDLTKLGFGVASDAKTDSGSYIINVTAAGTDDFTAQAVYTRGDNEATKCQTFQITGAGVKTSSPEGDCWVRTRN